MQYRIGVLYFSRIATRLDTSLTVRYLTVRAIRVYYTYSAHSPLLCCITFFVIIKNPTKVLFEELNTGPLYWTNVLCESVSVCVLFVSLRFGFFPLISCYIRATKFRRCSMQEGDVEGVWSKRSSQSW